MDTCGRPVLYTDEKITEIIELMDKYTESEDIPILAEFAYLNNIRRGTFYDQPGLSDATKRMTGKKEAQLERLALKNGINVSMAIFSLKQMGWSDKHEVTLENLTIGMPPELEEE